MIYTSYFSSKLSRNSELTKYSVARKVPAPLFDTADEFVPSYELLVKYKSNLISDDEYRTIYYDEVLNGLSAEKLYSKYNDSILLCWERGDKFCHRHLISEWFIENGFECEELQ